MTALPFALILDCQATTTPLAVRLVWPPFICRRRRPDRQPACCSKSGRDGDTPAGSRSLWLYRVACLSMLIYIVANSSSARTAMQQVQLATHASVNEAAALEICAAKGWVNPNAKPAAQPACPACECHCEAEACPQCPAAPTAAEVAAAKASANPPATTFCPWSTPQSVFKGHDQMVNFGRNESVCADTIM